MHRSRPYVMQADRDKKKLDERFTDLADVVSEAVGRWWITGISVIAVLIWLAFGPFMHFSDAWQLSINTPTTILEMWLGFLVCSAANRVERRNRLLLEQQSNMLANNHAMHERQLHLLEMVEALVEREQAEIEHIEHDMEHKESTRARATCRLLETPRDTDHSF